MIFSQEETLFYNNLNYNKNYKVSEDTLFNIIKILEAYKSDFFDIVYIGYANRILIDTLREFSYNVHVLHTFEETVPATFYEYQSKFFDEYDCFEGLPKHDLLLIDVPISIYNELNKSKVLLFGEADRKLYKKIILDKGQYKVNYKLEKALEFIDLAKIDDVYLIDRIQTAVF